MTTLKTLFILAKFVDVCNIYELYIYLLLSDYRLIYFISLNNIVLKLSNFIYELFNYLFFAIHITQCTLWILS